MTRFLHWRKLTWLVFLWCGGMAAWALSAVTAASGGCASGFGAASEFATRQDCLDAAAGGGGSDLLWIGSFWLLGVAVLGYAWWTTRPLWRQGRGIRLRRLREIETGWAARNLSDLSDRA